MSWCGQTSAGKKPRPGTRMYLCAHAAAAADLAVGWKWAPGAKGAYSQGFGAPSGAALLSSTTR